MSELKNCPFCGGEASRSVKNDILTVECNSCLISFVNHVRFGCRADSEWNTRANSEAIQAIISKLENFGYSSKGYSISSLVNDLKAIGEGK